MERKTLYAAEGMILTDGVIFGTQIHLADGVDENKFYEIPKEEYEEILEIESAQIGGTGT